MKRYSDELVKKLGEEKEIIQSYGTEVIFKESPVDGRKGYMDPYEIKALENQQEHVGEEKCNEISLEKLAQRMRDSMGYPNLNLNETEIITKCESLVLEKNNVGVWIRKDDNPEVILSQIFNSPNKLAEMKEHTKLLAKPNSTKQICDTLVNIL